MELIEIKEILRKASVEVDIQGHGKHIALFETDFERVAIELVKKLAIPVVSNSVARCGSCKQELTLVRPGKHQCDNENCPSNVF